MFNEKANLRIRSFNKCNPLIEPAPAGQQVVVGEALPMGKAGQDDMLLMLKGDIHIGKQAPATSPVSRYKCKRQGRSEKAVDLRPCKTGR